MNIIYVSQYFSFEPKHAVAITSYDVVNRLAEKNQFQQDTDLNSRGL